MDLTTEVCDEASHTRERISIDRLMRTEIAFEESTGQCSPLKSLYLAWLSNPKADPDTQIIERPYLQADARQSLGFPWIDVSGECPLDFVLHNHNGVTFGDHSGQRVAAYPVWTHARWCAIEYEQCKYEECPVAHYIDQTIRGVYREYLRLLVPVLNDKDGVQKIFYSYRVLTPPQAAP